MDCMRIEFTLNGQQNTFDVHPGTLLQDLLREHAPHDGDDVLVNGTLVRSSLTLAAQAHLRHVVTSEGLASGPIPTAFEQAGAQECGPSAMLSAHELLQRSPEPSEPEILEALDGLLDAEAQAKATAAIRIASVLLKENPAELLTAGVR